MKKRLAFLISGEGWLFEQVTVACHRGLLNAESVLLVTNNQNAGCMARAERLGVDSIYISSKGESRDLYSAQFLAAFKHYQADFVVTMFNRILSAQVVEAYKNRCINLHLSLLPSFRGINPRKRALDYGSRFSGATVHFIDAGVDTGPIIAQACFPIGPDTTQNDLFNLYGRILPVLLLNSLDYIVDDRYTVVDRRVFLSGARYDDPYFSPVVQEKFLEI